MQQQLPSIPPSADCFLGRIHNLCISAKLWRIHSNLIVRIRRIAVTLEFDRALAAAQCRRTTQPKRGILIFLPCAAIPYITAKQYALGFAPVAGKIILNQSATLVCGRFLHRCKADCVVCRRLSAHAQNPHKSQCQSCRVPFFSCGTPPFYCCAYSVADLGDIVYFQTMQNLRLLLCNVTTKKRSDIRRNAFRCNFTSRICEED